MDSYLPAYLLMGCAGLLFAYRRIAAADATRDTLNAAKMDSLSDIDGFDPAVIYEGLQGAYGLAIDPTSDQFAIAIPGYEARLYHFSQVVSAEVIRDDETVTTTNGSVSATGTAVATALIGPLGMILGAKTSSTSVSKASIKSLGLKLYVNDLHSPCFEIPFASFAMPRPTDSRDVVKAAKELDAWYSRFQAILMQMDGRSRVNYTANAIQYKKVAPEPLQESTPSRWITMR